jgi:hypothetical protein
LTKLDLGGNQIGDQGVMALAKNYRTCFQTEFQFEEMPQLLISDLE